MPQKIRVGFIMGGISSEREVSLESGRNIFSKIQRQRFDAIPIFIDSIEKIIEYALDAHSHKRGPL